MHWYSPSQERAFAIKADALLSADDIEFRLADKYDQYDWMKEPTRSWEDLVLEKCIQLRDENKYLRLWYSGGEDSHTILKCFMDNEIPIDEIAMMRNSFDDPRTCPSAKEINEYAAPYLQSNREKLLGAKIKYFDIGPDIFEEYYKTYSLLTSNQIDFRITCLHMYEKFAFPHMNEIDGIMNVFGVDKPLVDRDEIGYYWYQMDAVLMNYLTQTENTPKVVTHFYLDNPEIHHKQVYMAMESHMNGMYNPREIHATQSYLSSRDMMPGMEKRVLVKSNSNTRSDKLRTTVRGCLRNPETRHIYRAYLKAINNTGLDKSHFNSGNPIFFFTGIKTKKYRIL